MFLWSCWRPYGDQSYSLWKMPQMFSMNYSIPAFYNTSSLVFQMYVQITMQTLVFSHQIHIWATVCMAHVNKLLISFLAPCAKCTLLLQKCILHVRFSTDNFPGYSFLLLLQCDDLMGYLKSLDLNTVCFHCNKTPEMTKTDSSCLTEKRDCRR